MIKSLKQMVEALPQPLELQEEPESKYTILKNIGCMSTYREPRDRRITTKNHTCIEIKSLVKLLYGNRAAAFLDEETIKNLNNMAYTQWIKNYGR